jgi:hypothetical protein
MKTATFKWSVRITVRDDFDPNDSSHVAQARREAWQDVHESNGWLDDHDDDGLCPICGQELITKFGLKRCPFVRCRFNN